MTIAILSLALAGALLLGAEILLPGGVLGVLGVLCFLGGCFALYTAYGVLPALGGLVASLVLSLTTFFVEIKTLEKTKLGRKGILSASLKGAATSEPAAADIVGKCGAAITPMNPTGMVSVDEALYEAASLDGGLVSGDPIVVVGQDNFRLLVKKI